MKLSSMVNSNFNLIDILGMVLVSGSADHIAIWDLDNMVARYVISLHNDQVNQIRLQVCASLLYRKLR